MTKSISMKMKTVKASTANLMPIPRLGINSFGLRQLYASMKYILVIRLRKDKKHKSLSLTTKFHCQLIKTKI